MEEKDTAPLSDVVELIIAVDLNPSDPEEPINVNDVKVSPKGEGGGDAGEDWKGLVTQLLMGDPDSGITSDDVSFEMAKDAVARILGEDDSEDPFSKATKMPMGKPDDGMMSALSKTLDNDDDEEEEF